MSFDSYVREQRLRDGCCPNCGTRLYKVAISGSGVMSKMFKKMNVVDGTKGLHSSPDLIKMTPLTIPGVVERGQCIRCADGITSEGVHVGGVGRAVVYGVPSTTVNAVPVFASQTASGPPTPSAREKGKLREVRKLPPPQSKPRIKANDILGDGGEINHGDLKQPPEDLLGLYNDQAAASGGDLLCFTGGEEDESESDISSEDDESLEDYPLLDMNFCHLETDHASISVVNSLRSVRSGDEYDMDDRKPPAKPRLPSKRAPPFSPKMEKSSGEILEPTTQLPKNDTVKFECPLGMSHEVFYELPIEMQKEVVESRSNDARHSSGNAGLCSNATSPAGDVDPEFLASLPEQIRQEILEQATREQLSDNTPHKTRPAATISSRGKLSVSTVSFLTEYQMNEEDFNILPEDIKNDIINEKSRSRGMAVEGIPENKNIDESGYDPEALASLPEEVRKEVLDEARRQREKQRQKNNKPKSVVGAHSVDAPAGYDAETFAALPEYMQQELRDDATRQRAHWRYSADEYDNAGIIGAPVVLAQPMRLGGGTAESCTYEGEYNDFGKRHGDGVLKWANGDEYVGKFKDGFIEGRGTINFHDGTEYSGQWMKNRFHGEGCRRFNNGNVYNGQYICGKRQGLGKCYFANGDTYVGDWKKDTIHGFGKYYYSNGHRFEGMFRDGKRNGRGKYQLTDGRVEIYRYVNDCRVGSGVRWSANRKKAWLMIEGKAIKRVTSSEALAIAKDCGPIVEEP
ncbi:hypothetical protein ACHAW5_006951 [Stephanodiscus triporus]|uniref:Uncharacterized protein n=1 Tax=Stephanodiscus triporus TaxID=2934178 RepID=A0ABD3MSD0_9STRA